MLIDLLPIAGLCFMTAWGLTGLVRLYAIHRDVLDHPNERSSHTTPTPRGGGFAIVVVVAAGLAYLLWSGRVSAAAGGALAGSMLLVAGIGLWDDHRDIPARYRFLVQLLGAGWVLAWVGGLPPLPLLGRTLDLGWIGHGIALIGIVWLINLYNFMDGIDGLAGGEAVTVAGGMVLFDFWLGAGALGSLALVLGAASLGFLLWNWPRAKIFMGDVGSGFLGLAFAILLLAPCGEVRPYLWSGMILLGCFAVDATLTLLRRMKRGERWYAAHRSHAYQHASRRWGHLATTLGVLAINLGWLLPLAFLAHREPALGSLILAVAWTPLGILALSLQAGVRE